MCLAKFLSLSCTHKRKICCQSIPERHVHPRVLLVPKLRDWPELLRRHEQFPLIVYPPILLPRQPESYVMRQPLSLRHDKAQLHLRADLVHVLTSRSRRSEMKKQYKVAAGGVGVEGGVYFLLHVFDLPSSLTI